MVSATIAILAIGRGGLPADAGAPPDPDRLKKRCGGHPARRVGRVSGRAADRPLVRAAGLRRSPAEQDNRPWIFVQEDYIKSLEKSDSAATAVYAVLLKQVSTPAGVVLAIAALLAYGYLLFETFRMDTIARHRMGVVLILFVFCMLFLGVLRAGRQFHEQLHRPQRGPRFRRATQQTITASDVGKTIRLEPTQEQLGFHNGDRLFTLDVLEPNCAKNNKEHAATSKSSGKWPRTTSA